MIIKNYVSPYIFRELLSRLNAKGPLGIRRRGSYLQHIYFNTFVRSAFSILLTTYYEIYRRDKVWTTLLLIYVHTHGTRRLSGAEEGMAVGGRARFEEKWPFNPRTGTLTNITIPVAVRFPVKKKIRFRFCCWFYRTKIPVSFWFSS